MIENFIQGIHSYQFLQHALVTAITIGIVSGALGSLIILRGMSLMGDAISHAVLPGVALSYILGQHFFVGALFFGIVASILITYIHSHSKVKTDTAIGIIFSGFLALGVILIGVANSTTDLFHILFGNILAVTQEDMFLTIFISAFIICLLIYLYKPFLITSFDNTMAKAFGMNTQFYHYLLMIMLTVVAVTGMQSVGTILIVSLLITPAATAYLLTKHLWSMMILAAFFGAFASFIGLFIAYSFNIAAGSCMVLVSTVLFLITFIIHQGIHLKKGSLL